MRVETADFYTAIPPFTGFAGVLQASRYRPVPGDWIIGLSDVVESTRAIDEGRYKAVNMAGAAVIAAVRNALGGRDLPFVFGGDGASFVVSPRDAGAASAALAATAAWVRDDLDLTLRIALVPVAAVREQGLDLTIARYRPSANLAYAMFSGGGLAFAERAMKEGRFAIPAAPVGTLPDLTGLSCRFEELPASRGVMLSLVVVPSGARQAGFRALADEIIALIEGSPAMGRPVPTAGPAMRWPPSGLEFEVRAGRRPGRSLWLGRAGLLARTLGAFLVFRLGMKVGRFSPQRYVRELVENTDFRKYDDGLRMTVDCTPELATSIEDRLKAAEAAGMVRFGIHRQTAAIMTCISPSPAESEHVHFVDGAAGGYAQAARQLKFGAEAAA